MTSRFHSDTSAASAQRSHRRTSMSSSSSSIRVGRLLMRKTIGQSDVAHSEVTAQIGHGRHLASVLRIAPCGTAKSGFVSIRCRCPLGCAHPQPREPGGGRRAARRAGVHGVRDRLRGRLLDEARVGMGGRARRPPRATPGSRSPCTRRSRRSWASPTRASTSAPSGCSTTPPASRSPAAPRSSSSIPGSSWSARARRRSTSVVEQLAALRERLVEKERRRRSASR